MKNLTKLRPALLVCLFAVFSTSMFGQADAVYASTTIASELMDAGTGTRDIEKLDVEVKVESNRAKIEWVSYTGYKNDYFEIQKLDVFTNTYETIATVNSTATSNFYYDNAPIDGENFYRVKTVYLNNASRTSDVSKLVYSSGDAVKIIPSVTNDYVDIDFSSFSKDGASVSLYNSFGENLILKNIKKGGESVVRLDVAGQKPGEYFLRVSADGKRDVTKRMYIKH